VYSVDTHSSSLPPVPGLEPVALPSSSSSQLSSNSVSASAEMNRSVVYVLSFLGGHVYCFFGFCGLSVFLQHA